MDLLRLWVFDLNCPKFNKKMAIVDVLLKNGVDYRKTPVPKRVKDQIMKLHPNDWEQYLEVYEMVFRDKLATVRTLTETIPAVT